VRTRLLGRGDPTSKAFGCGGSGTTSPALFQTYNRRTRSTSRRPAHSPSAPTARSATSIRDRPVQLRAVQLLPASGRAQDRGLFAHYDMSDKATVYTEFMFMDDRTTAQIAPSGAFLGSGPDNRRSSVATR
jgi:hypothetical protein